MANTSKRAEYLRGEITFNQYYGLLVEHLGEGSLRFALPDGRTGEARTPDQWRELLAEDENLNNVPLRRWDAMHEYVRALVSRSNRDGLVAITGSGGWSLADSVCVLKEAARRYAQEGER